MRDIHVSAIADAVKKLCMEANVSLEPDVLRAFDRALTTERSTAGKQVLTILIEYEEYARQAIDDRLRKVLLNDQLFFRLFLFADIYPNTHYAWLFIIVDQCAIEIIWNYCAILLDEIRFKTGSRTLRALVSVLVHLTVMPLPFSSACS